MKRCKILNFISCVSRSFISPKLNRFYYVKLAEAAGISIQQFSSMKYLFGRTKKFGLNRDEQLEISFGAKMTPQTFVKLQK